MAGFATPKPVSQVDLPTGKDQIRKAGDWQKGSGAPSTAVLFKCHHWPWSWREATSTAQGHSGQSYGIPQPVVTPVIKGQDWGSQQNGKHKALAELCQV